MISKTCIFILATLLAGCASTGIISTDKDTYEISKTSAAGAFGTTAGVKGDIYSEANLFCAKQNKSVITVNIKELPPIPGRLGSATLSFRCGVSGPKGSEMCADNMANDPELSIIKNKVALRRVNDQTFTMLADNTLPTANELAAIRIWGNKRDTCLKMTREEDQEARLPAVLLNLNNSYQAASQLLIAELANGNLTYSGLAVKRQAMVNFFNDTSNKVRAELRLATQESMFKAEKLALEAQRNSILSQQIESNERVQQQRLQTERSERLIRSNSQTTTDCNSNGVGGISCTTR